MDDGPILWDDHNRRHLTEDHPERGITLEGVVEAMSDPNRIEDSVDRADGIYGVILGETVSGTVLFVAYVERQGSRYPVHARQPGRRLVRRYRDRE